MLGSQICASSISVILASSSSGLPVTSISATSSFNFIEHVLTENKKNESFYEHVLVVYGQSRTKDSGTLCMLHNIDVWHSKLMYPRRKWFMSFSNLYYYA